VKVGDVVKVISDKDYCNDKALGIIVESKSVAATRKSHRGRKATIHQVAWAAPSYNVVWIMQDDLTQVVN